MNRAQRPGIFELAQVARVEPGKINTTSIGYMLGPRINAAGRLDDAMVAYRLLTSDMPEAGQLAQQLQELNTQRQSLTMEAVEIARERVLSETGDDLPLMFAANAEFLSGIVGLVAGRLCEEFYVPAVVVEKGEEESRGSCRSIPEFNITHALDQCADLLVRHGGHAQAAGFTVRNENLSLLRDKLIALAAEALRGQDLRPTLEIDAEVPFDALTMDLAEVLRKLEPTGARNEAAGLYDAASVRGRLPARRAGWAASQAAAVERVPPDRRDWLQAGRMGAAHPGVCGCGLSPGDQRVEQLHQATTEYSGPACGRTRG